MSREQLKTAHEKLQRAGESAESSDVRERLESLADQVGRMANADRTPDQGRIDRVENALNDVEARTDGETRTLVAEAHEGIRAFRGTVGGV